MAARDFSVAVFARRMDPLHHWHALGFGRLPLTVNGRSSSKVRERFVASCRERVRASGPAQLAELQLIRGRKLVKVRVELTVRCAAGRERFAGKIPLILEPRLVDSEGAGRVLRVAYHPLLQRHWFPYNEESELGERASAYFQRAWSELELLDERLAWMRCQGRESLQVVGFRAEPQSLLGKLSSQRRGPEMAQIGTRRRRPGTSLLSELGFDLTRRASEGELEPGMAREPYREQLRQLLCGARKAPLLLIGPPGVGKTTLLHRAVIDLLDSDGWATHQNLDRVHHLWQISGRRIIAGMSYLGQWEQRCVELLEETYAKRILLYVEDLHAWGRIGESKQSDRNLASFFRGPVARGELTLVGECTPEQFQQLQADASALANLFTTLHVEPTDAATTLRMLVHEARKLELVAGCAFDPRVYRSIYELSGSLFSGSAYPGKALELVRALAARHRASRGEVEALTLAEISLSASANGGGARTRVGTPELISLLAKRTGMPALLLAPEQRLAGEEVAEAFRRQVMGQPQAVAVVRDLIVRIKAGLCDPGRPYGVFLFTGPTGTGKTEMAKALAEYLFGDASRLVRLDMSEYNVPGAAARLIGDRFQPEGVLTSRVRGQPFCVVLLDEVEKADPSVLNLMLQLFDDGRLSDAAGEVADFRHAVVIMTSNLGAGGGSSMGFGGQDRRAILQDIARAVREFFPPELFNRIDRVVEFRPLSPKAARAIARKELAHLLGRRGLVERNTFVRYTETVLDEVVREGFNARDGARSLKRWLEDNIGSLLVETLTRSQAASMRLLWLYAPRRTRGDGPSTALAVHEEALREAEAIPEDSRIGELLDQPNAALLAQVPAALDFLRELDDSPRLRALSQTLAELLDAYNRKGARKAEGIPEDTLSPEANALYNLELLRGEISELREALELHAAYDHRLEGQVRPADRIEGIGEQLELEKFTREEVRDEDEVTHTRRYDRRQFSPSLPLREREQMLRAIARVWFLERAIANADDPSQHAVFLEVSRISDPGRRARFAGPASELFESLVEVYARPDIAHGDLEAWAALRTSAGEDEILAFDSGDEAAPSFLELARDARVEQFVLQIVGPSVREFFAGESGCQVLESLGGGHEIVRVRVLEDEPGLGPRQLLERTLGQRARFVRALESGDELPQNPDAMLAIIRRFKLEEGRGGRPPVLEVEDYPLSHASSHQGRSVAALLPFLWFMRVGVAISQHRQRAAPQAEGDAP